MTTYLYYPPSCFLLLLVIAVKAPLYFGCSRFAKMSLQRYSAECRETLSERARSKACRRWVPRSHLWYMPLTRNRVLSWLHVSTARRSICLLRKNSIIRRGRNWG